MLFSEVIIAWITEIQVDYNRNVVIYVSNNFKITLTAYLPTVSIYQNSPTLWLV